MSNLAWDAYIENESEFVLLPEGDYDFTITKFERTWYDGSSKIEPCNCASIELSIVAPGLGRTTINERLFLADNMEWKLCEFFRCIGQKVHGKGVKMNWDVVLGAQGRAHIIVNEFQGNDGQNKKNNRVQRYLDMEMTEGDW